jgi:LPS-assembly protein
MMLGRAFRGIALAGLLAVSWPAGLALARDQATLVADNLQILADSQLVADGSVEVFFQGRHLSASKIVFNQKTDRLLITGPIRLTEADGKTVILGSQADLASDLTEGILTSARVVLDRQLQMAAAEMHRVGGRYLQLDNAVASSCKVCAGSSTPLWEIRARRVIRDEQAQQIYFQGAQLRVAGVPVAYIPRLRMPDSTLKRSPGFLMPSIINNSGLGIGIKLPYFLPIGKSRDLTFTPFISSQGGRTLDVRYRQATRSGDFTVSGALTRDEIRPGKVRGYLSASGDFRLPRQFTFAFSGEYVSDPGYLDDYNVKDADRLASKVEIRRVRRDEYISGRLIGFNSLRSGEKESAIPTVMGEFTFQRRFTLGRLGGDGGLKFQLHSHARSSTSPVDGNGDGIADGRDLSRGTLAADWRKDWILPGGLVGAFSGDISADVYSIQQDAVWAGQQSRLFGAVAAELRWPLVRKGADGSTQILEPVAQVVWSPKTAAALPNEDSVLVEFDEGNLFSLNRFPGSDAVETGFRTNLGVNWSRIDANGWNMGATVGRVFRETADPQFGQSSGLSGLRSDWMTSLQMNLPNGISMTARALIDDQLSFDRGEMRVALERDRFSLATSYLYAVPDLTESRPDQIAELTTTGRFNLTGAWSTDAKVTYDIENERTSRAAFGLSFRNECLLFDLSLSRRFTSSTSVSSNTNIGLSVDLLGFGGGKTAGPARMCRR